MRPVIAAIDFPDLGQGVLATAGELARAFKAPLVLLHVIGKGKDANASTAREDELESLRSRFSETGLTVMALTARGDHADEIVATATRMNAAMVVMGRHGRSGLRSLLLGSTSQEVIRALPCPVTLVPVSEDLEEPS